MNLTGRVFRFGLAAGATGLALALDLGLRPLIHPSYEPLFLLAIAAAAILGGLGPAILALGLSLAALNWWFFPPEQAFGFESRTDLIRQLVFAISGLLIGVLGARARALERLAQARVVETEFRLVGAEGRLAQVRRRRSSGDRKVVELNAGETKVEERRPEETVLIVDPDSDARQLASRAVESAGYRWVSACDGVEALELLDRYDVPFALVVTDVGLPDIPGPELMDRISARRPGLPVLYTSLRPPGDGSEPGAVGADQPLLEKPFTPDELLRRTREILGRAGGH
ncbi:MAG: response regulator [Gemmatimonadales bacterium]